MKIKYTQLFIFFLTIIFVASGCGKSLSADKKAKKIGDLIGGEVMVIEGTESVPYIVLTNNYNGNTLLLRKNLLDKDMRMTDYYAIYDGSEVDTFLNDSFFESIDESVRNMICSSNVEVVADDYYTNGVRVKGMQRKIFLLSYQELGISDNYHVGDEGEALNILCDSSSRIAYKTGKKASSWWLRSVDTAYENCFYAIGSKGEVGSTDASGMNGVRPAFCLPTDTSVILSKEDSSEGVYVIDFQKQ